MGDHVFDGRSFVAVAGEGEEDLFVVHVRPVAVVVIGHAIAFRALGHPGKAVFIQVDLQGNVLFAGFRIAHSGKLVSDGLAGHILLHALLGGVFLPDFIVGGGGLVFGQGGAGEGQDRDQGDQGAEQVLHGFFLLYFFNTVSVVESK